METHDHGWVYDREEIAYVNENDQCPCEGVCNDDECPCEGTDGGLAILGRFTSFYWCQNCHRTFAIREEDAAHPHEVLATDKEGVVAYKPEYSAQMGLLLEMDDMVRDYIEFSPTSHGDVYLYASDGLFVGCLIYDTLGDPFLRSLVIAADQRRNGYGTEFVESWFQREDETELAVMANEDTMGFYRSLDIPVTESG